MPRHIAQIRSETRTQHHPQPSPGLAVQRWHLEDVLEDGRVNDLDGNVAEQKGGDHARDHGKRIRGGLEAVSCGRDALVGRVVGELALILVVSIYLIL